MKLTVYVRRTVEGQVAYSRRLLLSAAAYEWRMKMNKSLESSWIIEVGRKESEQVSESPPDWGTIREDG